MDWVEFVEHVRQQLAADSRYIDFGAHFDREQALTQAVAKGLRKLFADSYGVTDSKSLCHHVLYRNGDEPEDSIAWRASRPLKYTVVRDLRFVPDVLIRRSLTDESQILPIEIKLIQRAAHSQDFAKAIGQCFVYSVKYPLTIMFIGVTRGVMNGTDSISDFAEQSSKDTRLRDKLASNGIVAIFREVGD